MDWILCIPIAISLTSLKFIPDTHISHNLTIPEIIPILEVRRIPKVIASPRYFYQSHQYRLLVKPVLIKKNPSFFKLAFLVSWILCRVFQNQYYFDFISINLFMLIQFLTGANRSNFLWNNMYVSFPFWYHSMMYVSSILKSKLYRSETVFSVREIWRLSH